MPVTKSAEKKVKQDKKRTKNNLLIKKNLKEAIKDFIKNPDETRLKKAYSRIDIASKKHIIHQNKADRLKSRLSKKIKLTHNKPTPLTKKSSKKILSK